MDYHPGLTHVTQQYEKYARHIIITFIHYTVGTENEEWNGKYTSP